MQLAKTPEQKTALVSKIMIIIERQVQVQFQRVSKGSLDQRGTFPDSLAKSALLSEIQDLELVVD